MTEANEILKSEYKYTDYVEQYRSIMQFNKNKTEFIHQWYPFVEGYSKQFIRGIIDELPFTPKCCLEPFSGSGTTPLELQKLGIKCISFEVNPFMHHLAVTKMRTDYTVTGFEAALDIVKHSLGNYYDNIEKIMPKPKYRVITETENAKKWNFHMDTFKGVLDIKYAIQLIADIKYRDLFTVALASILLEVSNVYRNGKCMSYKDDWQVDISYSREEVHSLFLEKLEGVFYSDIQKLNRWKHRLGSLFSNAKHCHAGDCREKIDQVPDNSIDLVITSPPYLNSRDYTDTYMVELWTLGFVENYDQLKDLRKSTLRSHVQVRWGELDTIPINELQLALDRINEHKEIFWNKEIPNMIKGYFLDIDKLFQKLYLKVISGGRVYFNVANSAYYGVEIRTDKIVAEIAERYGFKILEIRRARKLRPSVQQKEKIPYLWEVVIVMSK